MVKRGIGIDVNTDYVCAVQIAQYEEHFQIEKVFRGQTRRASDSLSGKLENLLSQEGFDRNAAIAASLPAGNVFFHTAKAESAQIEKLPRLDKSLFKYKFPLEPEDTIVQACSYQQEKDNNYSVLLAATSRKKLYEILNDFTKARVEPQLVDAPTFGIYSTVAVNHPEINTEQAVIIYLDKGHIILIAVSKGEVKFVRNIPLSLGSDDSVDSVEQESADQLVKEIKATHRKAFSGEAGENTRLYLTNNKPYTDELKRQLEDNLNSQVNIINPFAKIKVCPECKDAQNIQIAEGLALRQLSTEASDGVNFLRAENLNDEAPAKFKKDLTVCGLLILAIGIMALIGLFVKKSVLESQYNQLEAETKQVFRNTLPEETKLVAPLVQLEQNLKSLRKDYLLLTEGGFNLSPMKSLHIISTSIPPDTNIKINDMLITADSIRITGTAESFESVYTWKDILQQMPEFSNVRVNNNSMDTENESVYFTILASSVSQE